MDLISEAIRDVEQTNAIGDSMVENKAFNGDKVRNTYNFKHFNVNYLALHVDGKQIPAKPLTLNFSDKSCMRSFTSLFSSTGFMGQDRGNHISHDEYADRVTRFAFDLTTDLHEGGYFHLVKQGNLRLELHFPTQLPETINVIAYAKFDNVNTAPNSHPGLHGKDTSK